MDAAETMVSETILQLESIGLTVGPEKAHWTWEDVLHFVGSLVSLDGSASGNQFSTFDSPRDHPQRIQSDDVQRNWEAFPEAGRTKTVHTSEDRLNQGTIPMPTFATNPLTTISTMLVESPQNYMVGQQRQEISELQFDKFHNPSSFLVWKIRFKNQVTT